MVVSFGDKICLMRFFWRIVIAYVLSFFVYRNARPPAFLKTYDADKPRLITFVWLSYILRVTVFKHFPKIFKSVIVFYAVYVVNILFRPYTSYKEPSQTMRLIDVTVDTDSNISDAFFAASGNVAYLNTPRDAFTPLKQPCLGLVIKHLTKPFRGKFCHINLPMLNMYDKIILREGQA